MLEYLLNFIKNNEMFLVLIVLGLLASSLFSKKIKMLFWGLIGCAGIFALMMLLHHWGLGLDKLYFGLGKIVIFLCEWVEYFKMLLFSSEAIRNLMQLGSFSNLNDIVYEIIFICFLLLGIFIFVDFRTQVLGCKYFKKIKIKIKYIIKKCFFINTIREGQPKFILNLCFRC